MSEKLRAGAVYVQSPAYKARFGDNTGCWLVVTTGLRRLEHLRRQVQQIPGVSNLFFFSTLDQVKTRNVLSEPIWWHAGRSEPVALLSN